LICFCFRRQKFLLITGHAAGLRLGFLFDFSVPGRRSQWHCLISVHEHNVDWQDFVLFLESTMAGVIFFWIAAQHRQLMHF
jgi:hypothetical protein